MRLLFSVLQTVNDWISRVVMVIVPCLMGLTVLVLFGGAITRYITGIGFGVFQELPPKMMPWMIIPVAGCLLRGGSHISVDFLPERLGARAGRILNAVIAAIVMMAGITFLIAGVKAVSLFRMTGQMTEMELSFPIWWIYLSFPVGFAILTLFGLENFLKALLGQSPSIDDTERDARAMSE